MACLLQISHLPLLINDVNTNFLLGTKYWLRGGVGGQFPRILHWRLFVVIKGSVLPSYKESVLQTLFYTELSKDLPVRNKRVLQKHPYNEITPRNRLCYPHQCGFGWFELSFKITSTLNPNVLIQSKSYLERKFYECKTRTRGDSQCRSWYSTVHLTTE